jgi:hypothetical protein
MARNYLQGKYTPINPKKYAGNVDEIIYRSSWEKKLFLFLDKNPDVLKWGSEELIIEYFSPVDKRVHRYFPDVVVMYKNKAGDIKRAVVEVKPEKQTKPPTGKKMTKYLMEEYKTYTINTAKWQAATDWCKKNGFDFLIFTEKHLGI